MCVGYVPSSFLSSHYYLAVEMAGPLPSLLLPHTASVDPLGFLHRDCASTTKLKFLLPSSSSPAPAGFLKGDNASIAIAAKLNKRQRRVKASPVCELGLESEQPSESTTEAPLPSSCSSSSSSSSSPSSNLTSERGIVFSTGSSFFRAQSSLGRDLAVLAAALYKRTQGQLRVLDAMSGCGVRALRYLTQADADFVLANDCNPALHTTIVENMSRYAPHQGLHCPPEPFIRSCAPGDSRKPCSTKRMEYVNSMENSSSIESLSSTVNHGRTDNPSRTDVLGTSSEAEKLLVEAASTVENPRQIDFTSNRSTENPSSSSEEGMHPHEARNLDHDRSSATPATLRLSPVVKAESFDGESSEFVAGPLCNMQHTNRVKWQVCHEEASRLLLKCNLNMDFFDFIDVDSFGSDSFFLGPALSALRFGGLLFVTCTDGFSSGGHRPYNSLAQYGTFMKPMPYANELGLRMLMGAVVKEASLRNMTVSPIFSVYAPHGPVFRVLLRATAGKPNKIMHYRFIYYCGKCGDSKTVDWERLGMTCCPCSEEVSDCIKMSGPLWTGPLHNAQDIQDMIALAKEWGWISDATEAEGVGSSSGSRRKKKPEKLLELLNLMLDESHPELPFGFIHLDEIAKRGKIQSPRRESLIQALRNEGYVVSRSQVCPNAVKTNCSMTSCITLAQRLAAGTQF